MTYGQLTCRRCRCKHRIPLYPDSLLLAARKHPNFLGGIERHLAAFLAEPAAKRYALPPMPREVRAVQQGCQISPIFPDSRTPHEGIL